MTTETRLHYDIDNDISVEIVKEGRSCYFSIYNDRTNKAVATQTTVVNIKGLADFLNKHLENE